MAAKKEPTPNPGKEAQGVTWVASTGIVWTESALSVDKLKKWAEGPYGDRITQNLRDLIFPGPPTVRALHRQTNEADPELSAWLTAMADQVKLAAKIQLAWHATFWYGPSLQSPAIERVENEWRLTELRYLPPDSFANRPTDVTPTASCPLLPGIVLVDGEVQYWQQQDETSTTPERVENVLAVHDPVRPELGSRPGVAAITSAFAMLEYVWQAEMQRCHRTGSPLLFVRIIGARTKEQLGGTVQGDVAYAQALLKNWGRNTGYTLRENMELVDPHIQDTASNLETIAALTRLVDDHFSPASWISKDGRTLGGSAAPELQLLCSKVRGIQSWLEEPHSALFTEVLEINGLADYRAVVEIPDLEFDQRELDKEVAEASYRTRDTTRNERRKLYGLPPLDEAQEAALEAEYARSAPAPTPAPFGNVAASVTAPMAASLEDDLAAAHETARAAVLKALGVG